MLHVPASLLALCGLLLLTIPARAGSDGKNPPSPEASPEPASHLILSGEFDVSQSYVGSADVRRESRSYGISEHDSEVKFVLTPRTPLGYLRLGAEWNRFSFGLSDDAPLPNTLQAINLVLGLDTRFADSILVRIEAQPGLYGTFFNHLDRGDFNVPFIVGGTYIYSPNFQVIAGVQVDFNGKYPVFPGVGVRWKVAPKLVLDAVLPTPRVEYELTKNTTLFAGADVRSGNFRVDRHYGDFHDDPRLNRALVTFSEVRVGAGLTQRLSNSLTLSADGGCQPYREFDFYRANARYRSDGVAPYGQIAVHGAF